ncbi:hypothetical protein [Mycobacterium marinum]
MSINEYSWARQHARRTAPIWDAVALASTGMVAVAAWTTRFLT